MHHGDFTGGIGVGMGVFVGDASVGGPSGVGDADVVAVNGAGCVADHFDWVEFVVGAGFFDNDLYFIVIVIIIYWRKV